MSRTLGESQFIMAINDTQEFVHNIAKEKGFWDETPNLGEKIALCHSELSELLEASRKVQEDGDFVLRSEHIPDFLPEEEEAADVIIRLLDIAGYYEWDLGAAIVAKINYNQTRGYKHGKKF